MYSGDETGGIVADYGSHTCKFGFAGEDCPRLVRRTRSNFAKEVSIGISEVLDTISAEDHPVIATMPPFLSLKEQVEWSSKLFETGTSGIFLVRNSVASAFAAGKSTCLIVDIGASATTVSPVYDGHTLLKCTKRSESCGSDIITKALAKYVSSYIPQPISSSSNANQLYQYWDKIEDIKHICCRAGKSSSENETSSDVEYRLPDGKVIKLGSERFSLCDPLFAKENGITSLIYDCLASCEPDLRRTFSQEILIVGGGSLLGGLTERIGADLTDLLPQSFKPKLLASGSTIERRFAPFVGASVLASLGSFQQLWLSKKEWEESGEKLVADKFVQ